VAVDPSIRRGRLITVDAQYYEDAIRPAAQQLLQVGLPQMQRQAG
jgi:hypothetical protein